LPDFIAKGTQYFNNILIENEILVLTVEPLRLVEAGDS
jgi:hypothetical protein